MTGCISPYFAVECPFATVHRLAARHQPGARGVTMSGVRNTGAFLDATRAKIPGQIASFL